MWQANKSAAPELQVSYQKIRLESNCNKGPLRMIAGILKRYKNITEATYCLTFPSKVECATSWATHALQKGPAILCGE